MSYPLDLDEIRESALVAELARRATLRRAGVCDYCGRSRSLLPCKLPERHRGEVQ
jgi:hypothetical protein